MAGRMLLSIRRLAKWALVFSAVLVTTRLAGISTHGAMFVRTLLELLLFFALIWLPGQVLLWHLRPEGLDDDDLFLLAIPTTLFAYATLAIPLLWLSAPALVFKLLLWPALALAGVLFVRKVWREGELSLPAALPFTYLIAACAVCFVCVGQTSPWRQMVWNMPAARGLHELPIDNALPFMTAEVFIKGTKPWLMWPWTMGDRPPFMALLTALFAKTFLLRSIKYFDFTLLGILLNSLYALPLIHLTRKFIASRRTAMFVSASLILTPPLFVNSFFTWPKTCGMFFTMVVLAVFTRRAPDSSWRFPTTRSALVVGVLLGLSMLGHAGSALSIPLVLALLVCFGCARFDSITRSSGAPVLALTWPRKKSVLALAKGTLLAAGAVLLMQTPWKLYKVLHPEANTNLLLYHYIPFTSPAEPPPLLDWIRETGVEAQLAQRIEQVRHTLFGAEFADVFGALFTGEIVTHNIHRWGTEFSRPAAQVGELRIVLGAFSMLALAILSRWKRPRVRLQARTTPDLWMSGVFIALSIANYLAHVFLKWKSIGPHELPLVEIYLVAAPLTVACFALSRTLAALLLFAITERFLYYVVATTFARNLPVDLYAYGVFASAFGVLWLCLSETDVCESADRGSGSITTSPARS